MIWKLIKKIRNASRHPNVQQPRPNPPREGDSFPTQHGKHPPPPIVTLTRLIVTLNIHYVHYNVTLAIPSAKIAISTTDNAAKAKRITINKHVTKREYLIMIVNCCAGHFCFLCCDVKKVCSLLHNLWFCLAWNLCNACVICHNQSPYTFWKWRFDALENKPSIKFNIVNFVFPCCSISFSRRIRIPLRICLTKTEKCCGFLRLWNLHPDNSWWTLVMTHFKYLVQTANLPSLNPPSKSRRGGRQSIWSTDYTWLPPYPTHPRIRRSCWV
jgi:hypothetical protein